MQLLDGFLLYWNRNRGCSYIFTFCSKLFGLLVFFSQLQLVDVHIRANTYRTLRCTISNTLKTAPNDDNFALCKTAQKIEDKTTQWILKQKRMLVENRDSEIDDGSKTTTTRKPKFILDA